MENGWLPLIGGIILGAAVAEIVHKKCPGGISKFAGKVTGSTTKLYSSVTQAASEATKSFVEGYQSALKASTPV